MKQNHLKHALPKYWMLSIFGIILTAGIIVGLALGYDKLKELYAEQCVINNVHEQVTVTSGKMVKGDVLAEALGIRHGVNLEHLDLNSKRTEVLKKIPNLKAITITRTMPNKVSIVAEEREPLARICSRRDKHDAGKVVDSEGMVFLCQRGTRLLPLIRESASPGTKVGHKLTGRTLAALRLIEMCRESEFQELGILEVDTHKKDFLIATLSDHYSIAKIAWDEMDADTPEASVSLRRQLTNLTHAIRTQIGNNAVIWNVTDTSVPKSKIYADTKGNLP